MAGFCLRAHPLQNTQRKILLSSARPAQGCISSSFSHLNIPPLRNHRWLQHDHPGSLAYSHLQSRLRFLPGVCMHSPHSQPLWLPMLGAWDLPHGHMPFRAHPSASDPACQQVLLSLIHISEPTRQYATSRMPSSA